MYRGNPLLVSDHPAEFNSMLMYGSVVQRDDGLFQMWYTIRHKPSKSQALAYVESDDGIEWRRPKLGIYKYKGQKTHMVFMDSPHGATVFYDAAEMRPSWKYKMLVGAAPSHRICTFRSDDGIHWQAAAENPVTGSNPDSPMSLHRAPDGRYIAYHRASFGDRRVARAESWDFVHWTTPQVVIDQDPLDPPQTQFYGMGAIGYGPYEVGTLWIYRTDPANMDFYKMRGGRQYSELVYCRSGAAWHRAEVGVPFLPHGKEGTWNGGSLQAASSPLLLKDEIRFYFAGARNLHGEAADYRGKQPMCGIGMASCKPDRFVALVADGRAKLLTRPFWTETPLFFANAAIAKGGELRVAVLDSDGKPIKGFSVRDCVGAEGDSTCHELKWRGRQEPMVLANRQIRLEVHCRGTRLYAIYSGTIPETKRYWDFRIPYFLDMNLEKQGKA